MFHLPPFIAQRSTSILPSLVFLSSPRDSYPRRPRRGLGVTCLGRDPPPDPLEYFARLPSSPGAQSSPSPSLVSISSPSDSYPWRPRCALGVICVCWYQRWQCRHCAPSARPGGRGLFSRRGRRRRPLAPRSEIGPAAPYYHLSHFHKRATTPVLHSYAQWTLPGTRFWSGGRIKCFLRAALRPTTTTFIPSPCTFFSCPPDVSLDIAKKVDPTLSCRDQARHQ